MVIIDMTNHLLHFHHKPVISLKDSSQHLQDSSNNHDANHEAGDPSNVETMEPNDNQTLSSILETNEIADIRDSQNSLLCETTLWTGFLECNLILKWNVYEKYDVSKKTKNQTNFFIKLLILANIV